MIFLSRDFEGRILRFHVNLPGCRQFLGTGLKLPKQLVLKLNLLGHTGVASKTRHPEAFEKLKIGTSLWFAAKGL